MTFRYGILGTGNIAAQFAEGVAGSKRSTITAVASRRPDAAAAFADRFGLDPAHAHGGYDALLADDTVDAVYVSLPNHLHATWSIRALEAGKHVLCEKPLAVSRDEAESMFAAADRCGRLLMEAFMYRCHPLTHAVVDAVRGGLIGRVQQVRASFCCRTTRTDGNIRFAPEFAGGAMMDIGCYCVSFARLIAGEEPAAILAHRVMHPSGVDERATGVLRFPGGVDAVFACAMTMQADNTAWVLGEEGFIEVPIPWKPPQRGAVWRHRGMTPPRMDGNAKAGPFVEEHTVDAEAPLFGLEADAFAAAACGEIAVPVTRDDTLGNAAVLDQVRQSATAASLA